MAVNDKDIVEKAREISQGDVQVWHACMEMARWMIEDRVLGGTGKHDEVDWRSKTAALLLQLNALQQRNKLTNELLEKALHLIQDPKARWDSWIGEALPLLEKKKAS